MNDTTVINNSGIEERAARLYPYWYEGEDPINLPRFKVLPEKRVRQVRNGAFMFSNEVEDYVFALNVQHRRALTAAFESSRDELLSAQEERDRWKEIALKGEQVFLDKVSRMTADEAAKFWVPESDHIG